MFNVFDVLQAVSKTLLRNVRPFKLPLNQRKSSSNKGYKLF